MTDFHPDHLADLEKSGITFETATAAGFYSVPSRQTNKIMGWNAPVKSMLAIPYPDKGFTRYRLFPPVKCKADDRPQKYHQPQGFGCHLYQPPGFNLDTDTILITEGEKKALKAMQDGLNCCALGGIWNFAYKEDSKPVLIDDLKNITWSGKIAELVPDSDFQIKEAVRHAVYRLGLLLEREGATVNIVILPGDDKLDGFLCRNTITDFKELPRITFDDPLFSDVRVKEMSKKDILERGLIECKEFVELEMPQRPLIIYPFLRPGTIIMYEAPRGVGKTLLSMMTACAATRKGVTIGPWRSENPVGVIYVDAEMPAEEAQDRLKGLLCNLPPAQAPLFYMSHDVMRKNGLPTPNLVDPEWRDAISAILRDRQIFKLLILDNIASLSPGYDENSKIEWDPINQWLLSLRFMDVGVIMDHHTGKSGTQRGTSGREDNIDVSIKLRNPPGYKSVDGAKFTVEFTKARSVYGNAARSFMIKIKEEDGGLTWVTDYRTSGSKEIIIALLGKGIPQKNISDLVGCTKMWVSKVKKKAISDGFLINDGGFTTEGRDRFGDVDIEEF